VFKKGTLGDLRDQVAALGNKHPTGRISCLNSQQFTCFASNQPNRSISTLTQNTPDLYSPAPNNISVSSGASPQNWLHKLTELLSLARVSSQLGSTVVHYVQNAQTNFEACVIRKTAVGSKK